MAKGLIIKLAVAGAVVLACAGGGIFAALVYLPHHEADAKAAPPPPKPLYFAELPEVLVSIPPESGAAATSFVQFGVQFSTYDPKALVSFDQLQPIIKAEIISLLMSQTSNGLENPQTRASVVKNCLDISNDVLKQNGDGTMLPFRDAYITNLVVQD